MRSRSRCRWIPEAVVGTLPNGLRYYVRAERQAGAAAPSCGSSSRPGRCSKTTTSGARALRRAHAVRRHAALPAADASTTSWRRSGLSIGADANAATSYDDTQYTLRVPTDTPGVLDRALLILEDWAQRGDVRPERHRSRSAASCSSEWRMHLGAGERTQDKIRRVQLEGSRYADRPPIGDPDVIENAQREQLVRFYRDWYRPDLMAVIVVGDVDRDAVDAMIKRSLLVADARRRRSGRGRPSTCPIIPARATPSSPTRRRPRRSCSVSNLRPARNQGSVGGYRDIMLDQLFAAMLGARLDELSAERQAAVPAGRRRPRAVPAVRTRDEALLQALVTNDGVAARPRRAGHRAAARRALRLHRDRARARQAGDDARLRARRDRRAPTASRRAAPTSTRATSSQSEALPTIWQELAFHRRFMPAITLAEVNALAADWFPDQQPPGGRVGAGRRRRRRCPSEAQLAAVVKTRRGEDGSTPTSTRRPARR